MPLPSTPTKFVHYLAQTLAHLSALTKVIILIPVLVPALCAANAEAKEQPSVNIYSARHYDTDLALYDDFYRQTGIKVNLLEASSDALIERIANEGKYSPADILITTDAGRLYRAEQRGIFSAVESSTLEQRIPPQFRHPDKLWFGISKRARVIIYNKRAGNFEQIRSYQDLAKPEFKGKICVRSSSNIYNISLLASFIAHRGEAAALEWATQVVGNLAQRPQGNDSSNIKAVVRGKCAISIVNSYYLARDIAKRPALLENLGLIHPNQSDTGTHVNISGAGITRYAPNRENAIQFLEYLTDSKAQSLLVEQNHEYPIVSDAKASGAISALGTFNEDTLSANVLGIHQKTAVKIFDRAGWR